MSLNYRELMSDFVLDVIKFNKLVFFKFFKKILKNDVIMSRN